jgi:hypothetical protein
MCNSDSHIKLVVAVVTLYTLSDAARGSSNNNDTTVLVHILIEALVALLSEQYDATHVSHVSYHIHIVDASFYIQNFESKIVAACAGMPLMLELAGGRLKFKRDIEQWQVTALYILMYSVTVTTAFTQLSLIAFSCVTLFDSHQNVHDLLIDGAFNEECIANLIKSSLQLLSSSDTTEADLYESMLLDAATVFYGRNFEAAKCAWRAADKHAAAKLEQLIDYSLVKMVSEETVSPLVDGVVHKLWVHDVIKSIATKKAHTANKHCMTRVWLPDQVNTVTSITEYLAQYYAFIRVTM